MTFWQKVYFMPYVLHRMKNTGKRSGPAGAKSDERRARAEVVTLLTYDEFLTERIRVIRLGDVSHVAPNNNNKKLVMQKGEIAST